ncbi:MAG: hypothetical protein JW712_13695 [Dehalococcoidales bacterium]|nr:hypothetical protein [Dehalococcoidales bacterium]
MSEEKEKKTGNRKGPPKGNQNARKHGFYSKVLDESEQAEYEKAVQVEGFDEEIAMLRVKIMSLLEKDPQNVRLITQAINSMVRMMEMKHQMELGDDNDLMDRIKEYLEQVAVQFGVTLATNLIK